MKESMLAGVLLTVFALQVAAVAAPVKVTRAEDVGMSSERLEYLTSYFEGLAEDQRSGGFQILISRRGKVVLYENMGMANVEENIPVTDETLFRIYSMDGNMTLEPMKREPTIHDLLQHTAGFTYGIFGNTGVDKQYVASDVLNYDQKFPEFIDKLANIPLLFQPGARWNYSVSVDIQGYLIEKWTGMKLTDFLQERIFDPLGMDQTMAWVPPDKAGLLANVYTHDENGMQAKFDGEFATNHFRAPGEFGGGGQLLSTSDDYWRFCQMLLNGGAFEGTRYLSPLTVGMMSSNRLKDPASLPNGAGFGLNFGVTVDNTKGDYPTSNGEYYWGGLASTVFWIDPELDMVAIMMTQYLPFDGEYYRDLLHRLVRAAVIE